mmetsp:Transcript_45336/g.116044  ORF Transcript_45336/g.116044 Transcript_45336/m.116044 type:complete len:231 (-) Transcript_45336:13-705(-)|eukprot:jgi/Tetstr1/456994/TSEL_043659.t1
MTMAMASAAPGRVRAIGPARPAASLAKRGSSFATSSVHAAALRRGVAATRVGRSQWQPCGRPARLAVVNAAGDFGFSQRWRAARFAVKDKREELEAWFMSRPAVTATIAWWASTVLPPYRAAVAVAKAKLEVEINRYNDFLSEETKLVWSWKRETVKEQQVWKDIFFFLMTFYLACAWQAVIPVSFVLSIVIPSILSWIIWDGYMSPIGLSMVLLVPFKFVPWVPWVWFI